MNLYHYTSFNAFCSIITGKKLRFTKINFLNDAMEYDCGINFFKEELRNFEKANNISDGIDLQLIDLFTTKSSIYSISFCEDGNDLNLWRGYCPSEGGIAIGFDKDLIFHKDEIVINKCMYGNPYEDILTKESYEDIKKKYANLQTLHTDSEHIKWTFDLAHIKNESFKNEKEWRGITFPRSNIEYFVRNSVIVPYFEYPFNLKAITEIIIGPTKFQENNKEAIEMLARQHGVTCSINKSEIPFVQY
ncbi:DUF2971 domain-containing protein [Pedobacter sp.]|uniref:DUF2971 domain-containing protein n=1 Tax=Pedobacter sp. TaxID=1411316 RepID=UPI0031E00BA1